MPRMTQHGRGAPLRIMSFSRGLKPSLTIELRPAWCGQIFWTFCSSITFIEPLKLIHFWHARVIFAVVKLVRRRVSKWFSSWRLMRCDSRQPQVRDKINGEITCPMSIASREFCSSNLSRSIGISVSTCKTWPITASWFQAESGKLSLSLHCSTL